MKNNYLLAIETSSKVCSIAISNSEQILLEYTIAITNSHDLFLAELTNRALKDLSIKPHDLIAVSISSGPGSFTGLRIGAAFAKGLCFNNSIKLVPVPTLLAIAFQCKEIANLNSKKIVAVVHSHKNLYFSQTFDLNLNPLTEVQFQSLEKIENSIDESYFVAGFGAEEIHKGIQAKQFNSLTASIIAKLGWKLFEENKFINSEDFVPAYFLEFQPKTVK